MKINIDQNICDYMNAIVVGEKEYTLEEVKKFKRSVFFEKEDRTSKNIKINFNSQNGRKEINERTAIIAREIFKLNVTVNDINLFRKCKSMEAKERRLIKNLEENE